MNKRHGSPYDRGAADKYYGRGFNPHYFKGASYSSQRVGVEHMTQGEVEQYTLGYNEEEDRKEWD
jgi:hypothetical protein